MSAGIEHYVVYDDSGVILRKGHCSKGKALKKTMVPGEHIMVITGPEVNETQLDIKNKVILPATGKPYIRKT